jgi:hypothetical protein
MANAQTGDHYRAIVYGRLGGTVETRNMFVWGITTGTTNDDNVVDALYLQTATILDAVKPLVASFWTSYQCEFQRWVSGHWIPLETQEMTKIGTASGDVSSFQTAILFVLKTGVLREIGRKFFAGVAESMTTGGSLTTNALIQCALVLSAMLSLVTSDNAVLQLGIHAKDGQFKPFVSGVAGTILSTMRRRKPGYGI